MLNMNVYGKRKELSLFRFGFDLSLGGAALNRYQTGEYRGKFTFLTLISSGTGHWPFQVFDLDFLTGVKSAFQLTVLGFTIGTKMFHNVDEDTGELLGPDRRKGYWFFSGLNHQHKLTEEIAHYAD